MRLRFPFDKDNGEHLSDGWHHNSLAQLREADANPEESNDADMIERHQKPMLLYNRLSCKEIAVLVCGNSHVTVLCMQNSAA